jgi:hypothetical protein
MRLRVGCHVVWYCCRFNTGLHMLPRSDSTPSGNLQATQHQQCRVRVTIVNTDGVAADQLQKVVLVAALVAHSCNYLPD